MALTSNYSWLVYGSGGPSNPQCLMQAYRTDPSHNPTKWQENLIAGSDGYDEAVMIVLRDRDEALRTGNYNQSTINANSRWYLRTSKKTGNSWECVLDAAGNEVPNPCTATKTDPRNRTYKLVSCTVTETYSADKLTLTISGSLTT